MVNHSRYRKTEKKYLEKKVVSWDSLRKDAISFSPVYQINIMNFFNTEKQPPEVKKGVLEILQNSQETPVPEFIF